jgi:hypothetical protein
MPSIVTKHIRQEKNRKMLNVYDMQNIYPSPLNMQPCVLYTKRIHYKCKWHFSSRVNCVLVLKWVSSLELHKMPMSADHWCIRPSAVFSRTFLRNMAYWLLKSGYLSHLKLVFLYEWHVEGKPQAKHLGFWAVSKRQYVTVALRVSSTFGRHQEPVFSGTECQAGVLSCRGRGYVLKPWLSHNNPDPMSSSVSLNSE